MRTHTCTTVAQLRRQQQHAGASSQWNAERMLRANTMQMRAECGLNFHIPAYE